MDKQTKDLFSQIINLSTENGYLMGVLKGVLEEVKDQDTRLVKRVKEQLNREGIEL